jgi:hypothetical protein
MPSAGSKLGGGKPRLPAPSRPTSRWPINRRRLGVARVMERAWKTERSLESEAKGFPE